MIIGIAQFIILAVDLNGHKTEGPFVDSPQIMHLL